MLDLYKNIRARRKELHLTQEELAFKTGYTNKSSIASIESGRVDLPQSKIIEFAKALETTPGLLMGWDDFDDESDVYSLTAAASLVSEDDPVLSEIVDIYMNIDSEARSHLLEYARFISSQRK